MKMTVGLKSDPGPREGQNQDSILATIPEGWPDVALLIVADGMGGARGGEQASQEAVAVIHRHVLGKGLPQPGRVSARLREAIEAANTSIYHKAQSSPEMEGMGCTVVVALVIEDTFWVAHVGDSRAYLIRAGASHQLTHDHTWVDAQVREGKLTPDQAASHSLRHVLDRALGTAETIEADVWPDDILEEGDALVLCTDGLYGVLGDQVIAWAAANHGAQEAANILVERALSAPTQDNVSVVVLRVGNTD